MAAGRNPGPGSGWEAPGLWGCSGAGVTQLPSSSVGPGWAPWEGFPRPSARLPVSPAGCFPLPAPALTTHTPAPT